MMYGDTFIHLFHSSGAIPVMKAFFSPSFQQFIYLESDPCVSALFRFTVQLGISAVLMEPPQPAFLLFLQRSDIWKAHSQCVHWSLNFNHM